EDYPNATVYGQRRARSPMISTPVCRCNARLPSSARTAPTEWNIKPSQVRAQAGDPTMKKYLQLFTIFFWTSIGSGLQSSQLSVSCIDFKAKQGRTFFHLSRKGVLHVLRAIHHDSYRRLWFRDRPAGQKYRPLGFWLSRLDYRRRRHAFL